MELAERLGVSRTPVREALRLTLDEIAVADDLDKVEDPVVASSQLFGALREAAGSVYLANALNDLRGALERVWRYGRRSPWRRSASAAEQLLIVEAIIDQDETLATQAMAVHLHNSLAYLLRSMSPGHRR